MTHGALSLIELEVCYICLPSLFAVYCVCLAIPPPSGGVHWATRGVSPSLIRLLGRCAAGHSRSALVGLASRFYSTFLCFLSFDRVHSRSFGVFFYLFFFPHNSFHSRPLGGPHCRLPSLPSSLLRLSSCFLSLFACLLWKLFSLFLLSGLLGSSSVPASDPTTFLNVHRVVLLLLLPHWLWVRFACSSIFVVPSFSSFFMLSQLAFPHFWVPLPVLFLSCWFWWPSPGLSFSCSCRVRRSPQWLRVFGLGLLRACFCCSPLPYSSWVLFVHFPGFCIVSGCVPGLPCGRSPVRSPVSCVALLAWQVLSHCFAALLVVSVSSSVLATSLLLLCGGPFSSDWLAALHGTVSAPPRHWRPPCSRFS